MMITFHLNSDSPDFDDAKAPDERRIHRSIGVGRKSAASQDLLEDFNGEI